MADVDCRVACVGDRDDGIVAELQECRRLLRAAEAAKRNAKVLTRQNQLTVKRSREVLDATPVKCASLTALRTDVRRRASPDAATPRPGASPARGRGDQAFRDEQARWMRAARRLLVADKRANFESDAKHLLHEATRLAEGQRIRAVRPLP